MPLLRLHGLTKRFPGVVAVRAADLVVRQGEVVALVGENGAGKSTLIKMITGALDPDAGDIVLAGTDGVDRDLAGDGPVIAARAGITAIYQELNLLPQLTVSENLFLGRERSRYGVIDAGAERRAAREALGRLEADIDPEAITGELDVARQQLVEIARALLCETRLLILDEPTAALTSREVARLFTVIDELRQQGLGIVFISHRLDEVFSLADRIAVMRDGELLGNWTTKEMNRERLIELMVGRSLEREFPKQPATVGEEMLAVRGLSGGSVRDVSFGVSRGEVLGLAGLVGAGRTELARLIFGADRPAAGQILLDGVEVDIRTPRDAINHGIGLLTEDRKAQGLVLGLPAQENFALPNLGHWSRGGWIDRQGEGEVFQRYVDSLDIRLAGPKQLAGELSGGNQQKLLVARWLENDARVLFFDEPTRGIDVGAKYEIYLLLNELAAQGKAVVMISSELPEILGMSDRVLVMHEGRIRGEVTDMATASQESLLALAVG
ncbi:MAG: sugar ABC transporter ATP-binding protein [bacterium]